jgi:plastocyanin
LFSFNREVGMSAALRYGIMAAVVGVGATMWACGGTGGGDVTDPAPEAEIRVTLTRDGSGAPGVSVRLFAAGAGSPMSTTATDGQGVAVFSGLAAGSYEVEVIVPAGAEVGDGGARRPVSVSSGGTASVSFQLVSEPLTGTIEVRLTAAQAFSPRQVTLRQGATVRWINDSSMLHTITPQGHSEWVEATVEVAGDEFEHTFVNAGTFDYYCAPHLGAGMTGQIRVVP